MGCAKVLLVDGAWGTHVSARFDGSCSTAAAARAVAMARAPRSPTLLRIGDNADRRLRRPYYVTPFERDPATVPQGERIAPCSTLNARVAQRPDDRGPDVAARPVAYGYRSSALDRFAHRTNDLPKWRCNLRAGRPATATRRCACGPAIAGCTSGGGWEVLELAAELHENARAHRRGGASAPRSAAACSSGTMATPSSAARRSRCKFLSRADTPRARSHHGLGSELQRNELSRPCRTAEAALRFAPS